METTSKTPQEVEAIRAALRPYLRVAAKIEAIANNPATSSVLVEKVCRNFDRKRATAPEWLDASLLLDDLRESIEWSRRQAAAEQAKTKADADAMQPAAGRYAIAFRSKVDGLVARGIRLPVAVELANQTVDTHTTRMLAEFCDACGSGLTPAMLVAAIRQIKPVKAAYIGIYKQGSTS